MTLEEWMARVRETWQPLTPEQVTVIRATLYDDAPSQK